MKNADSSTSMILLADLYDEALEYVKTKLSPLLDVLYSVSSEMHDALMLECVLDTLAQPIIDCESLFTVHSQHSQAFLQVFGHK